MEKAAKNSTAGRAAGRTCVLVLGMHRSGTSALARVLNLLGCDLPKTLMDATAHNEAGHWESVEIMNLNDEILKSAGSTWLDWLEFNPGWYTSPKAEEYKERALATLEAEYGKSRLFVLKDPRICRFVPFWLDVLDAAGVKPVIVRQVRNPLEVAESLSKRNGIDPALGHLLWLDHVLEAEAGSRGRQRFQSSYDRLLKEWPSLVSEMQDALQISWPRMSTLTNDEIDRFLTEKLRHHEQSTEAVTGNPFISAWLRDTFSIFSRWAKEGESPDDYAELDRIRSELNVAAPAFSRLVLSSHQRASELKSARSELEELKGKVDGLEAERRGLAEREAALNWELKAVSTNLEEIENNLQTNQVELSQARSALTQSTAEVDAANAQLQKARESAEILKAELSQTQSALVQRTAEADAANAQYHKAMESAEILKAELSQTQSALAQRSAEAEEVTTQLAEARCALGQHETEKADIENRLADAENSLREQSELADEKSALARQLSERFNEIAALTRLLQQSERDDAAKANKLRAREEELAAKKRQVKHLERSKRLSDQQIAVLREVASALLDGSNRQSLKSKLSAFLPAFVRINLLRAQLRKKQIFDPDAYLSAHPDVAEMGLDPLRHYISHGILEGRELPSKQPQ